MKPILTKKMFHFFILGCFITVTLLAFQNCAKHFNAEVRSSTAPPTSVEELAFGIPSSASSTNTSTITAPQTTSITLADCKANSGELCAKWIDGAVEQEAPLGVSTSSGLIEAGPIGSHQISGKAQRLAYVYYLITSSESQLTIVNLDSKRSIAATRANAGAPIWGTNMGILRGPGGLKYPFLSPGYLPQIAADKWMWLCRFDPLKAAGTVPQAPAGACGTGFRQHTIDFNTPQGIPAYSIAVTKHSGFMIADVDKDGWDDVTFPFFQGHLVTFSGNTGAQIGFAQFDVAAAEGNYPPYYGANQRPLFHGGRFYGGFFEVKEASQPMQVVVAGDIVGRFHDGQWCNVSRYVAGLRWSNGFQLAWSRYTGWGRTLFNDDGSPVRQGDEQNRCIHRISDSVLNQDAQSYVIYNQFDVFDRSTQCNRYALNYQGNISSAEAAESYQSCLNAVAATKPGFWHIEMLNAQTGQTVSSLNNHYVWGRVDGVWPNTTKALFLLHQNHGEGNFYQTAENLKGFTLAQVDNGQFSSLGTLDCPSAVPSLREGTVGGNSYGTYPYGKNTSTDNVGLRDIATRDIDGDGLKDILLADGRWIGHANGKLAYKNGAAPVCVRRAKVKWTSNGLYSCRVDNGAVVVSGNSNGDRSGAWPTAPMSSTFVTADLKLSPRINFICLSPDGWNKNLEDFKVSVHLQPQGTDGSWTSKGARACGINNGSTVVGGASGGGEDMIGFFNLAAASAGPTLNMDCASPWGWNNGINDRSLNVIFTPQ